MAVAGSLLRSPTRTANPYCCTNRTLNLVCSQHTAKWMQDSSKKSPMELINEIPPIKVEGRIVACEGDTSPAVGHPIEFICLDLKEPAVCNTAVFPFKINYLP